MRGEDYCFSHSDSSRGYQSRVLAIYKRQQSGRKFKLIRLLNRTLRSKKADLAEKCKIMIRVFDLLDRCESKEGEAEEEKSQKKHTNFF